MFPTHYYIRQIRVEPNVVLAPMEGVTDLTFRRLIRQIGDCGMTTTEFIPSEGLRRGAARLEEMAKFDPDERPVAIQIYGRNPEAMAEAARIIEDSGADVCDLNFGCPSKKVCAHSGGSALLKDPELATQIVKAVRAAIRMPLTVKMRSGFDHTSRNAPDIAYMCQEEGAEAITIHWRTRSDLYSGVRAVDKIAEAKQRLRIPVIANGDVVDFASARRMFEETGCDGVMIGRGAVKNPWVIKQVAQQLRGDAPVEVDAAEKKRVLLGYIHTIRTVFRSDHGALGRIKKISNYFTHGLPYGTDLRTGILHSNTPDEVVDLVERYFTRLQAFENGEPWYNRHHPVEMAPESPA